MTTNEQTVKDLITIEAARVYKCDLMRNNSGAFKPEHGGMVRYGLGNTSVKLNKVFKSADLIGVLPVEITASMVGRKFGIFVAVEVKKSDWKMTNGEHELAQKAFLDHIKKLGGIAGFCSCIADFKKLIEDFGKWQT